MKKIFVAITMLLSASLSAQSLQNIPVKPSLFNEASSPMQERDMAISPDGSLMFYTIQGNQHLYSVIVFKKRNKDLTWSSPEVASFSGRYGDLEPAFTSDGKKLFFCSNRPLSNSGDPKDYDIWYVEKNERGWSEPVNAGPAINTAANEFYPAISNSGNLYFTAEYEHGVGKEDIFMSAYKNGEFQKSIPLDTAVNSKLWEFNAYVSPDETTILFTSYGRKGEMGGGDIYMSTKDASGKWKSAKRVALINSVKLDYCPFVSFDQQVLFFTSGGRYEIPKSFDKPITYKELLSLTNAAENGSENIYWVSMKAVLESLK
ncbi:TolB family protein [Pseudochryseolinea flava]|nr:PD40 domain-containing protein [Pseudochryseolinea flava]